MAFNEGTELKPRKLYTGLGDVNVVTVNPTLAELQELGLNYKEEPVYTTVVEGVTKTRVDIWVLHPVVGLQKVAFFVADDSKASSSGNYLYINDYGTSSWAASPEALVEKNTWFRKEGLRLAKSGEPELVDFIKNLLSVGKDSVAKIDNIDKIIKGDVSELKDVFERFKDRKVQVLFVVKQGSDGEWYQNIYTRYFSRSGNKSVTYWAKHITGTTSKPIYQESFILQEFDTLKYSSPTPSAGASGSGESDDLPW